MDGLGEMEGNKSFLFTVYMHKVGISTKERDSFNLCVCVSVLG